MPATLQEWFIALVLFLIGIFLIWIFLWVWGSIIKGVWQERSAISNFFHTNPIGEWILRFAVAIPAFGLLSMLFDPTFRTAGYFIFYILWLVIATFLYFVWL